MKKTSQILMIIWVVLLSGFSCTNQNKRVTATLTKTNGNDSTLKTVEFSDSSILDLKFCINSFDYPPKIPQNIYWIKPDTTGLTDFEKQNLVTKYDFDKEGRLITFYYQGSKISGIYPFPYFFKYDENNPALIDEISDWFYKIKYQIKYDTAMNIQWIEKLDSINKRIEILTIEIK